MQIKELIPKLNFQSALITGGSGFLGKAIIKELIKYNISVVSYQRNFSLELEQLGVKQYLGYISDFQNLYQICKTHKFDIVFHTAAKASSWGPYSDFFKTNVLGTKCIIEICKLKGIKKLVFTSSPSVIFTGKDIEGANESIPYPDPSKYKAYYPKTKAIAEKIVLKANSSNLATIALRPHLIWGPGDNHLAPRLIKSAKTGKLKIIGTGKNKIDTIFIDNAVYAHLLAANALSPSSLCSGKAYFVTNNEPRPIAEIINLILQAAGLPPVTKSINKNLAYSMAFILESFHKLLKLNYEPIITRWVVEEFASSHWFDTSAAKHDFGYTPIISINDGINILKKWYENHPVI